MRSLADTRRLGRKSQPTAPERAKQTPRHSAESWQHSRRIASGIHSECTRCYKVPYCRSAHITPVRMVDIGRTAKQMNPHMLQMTKSMERPRQLLRFQFSQICARISRRVHRAHLGIEADAPA
jgi:hypothetical protein